MIGLRQLWGGYVRVGITGPHPERLVNLMWTRRVRLWGLRAEDDGLSFCVAVGDIKAMRRLVRKAGCRVRFLEKRGARFPRQRLLRRRTSLLALAVFVVTVYAVTGFVWTVEIEGDHALPRSLLRDAMAEMGLYPGAWKGTVSLDRVERGLVLRFTDVAWAGARVEGTRVIVHVVEKVAAPPEVIAPGDLVAAADGVIDRMMVLRGRALVTVGDTVHRGQLLVEAEDDETGAQAVIEARVWYEAYAEASRVRVDSMFTGRVVDSWLLVVSGREVRLGGPEVPPFTEWEQDRQSWLLGTGRNGVLAVELIKLRYYEVYTRREVLGPDRARDQALREAREGALSGLPPEARVIGLSSQVVHETGDAVGVRVLVEVRADIGQHRERAGDDEGG